MEIVRPNRMKRKLQKGWPVFGAAITILHPELVEIAGAAGLDYIYMDLEHIPIDWNALQACVLASELHGITPLFRPTELSGQREYQVQMALDIGFQSILLTGVRNPSDMQAMLNVAKFPPQGRRGVGHGRVHQRAGKRIEASDEILREMNAEIFVSLLIESAEGVENIEALCAMDGVDAAGLGHRDYAMDAGLPNFDIEQEGMREALRRINTAARAHGKPFFGGSCRTPEELQRQVAEGALLFHPLRETAVWERACVALRKTVADAGFAG